VDRRAGLTSVVEYAAALPVRDGQVLLGLRAASKRLFPQCWDVIGGHIERGETPAEALVRELAEEIGLTDLAFDHWRTLEDIEPDGRVARLHVFRVTSWSPAEPAVTNDEHSEIRWFDLAEAERLQPIALESYRAMFSELRLSL
jgi:8-oxo-dGTP diphosphatase